MEKRVVVLWKGGRWDYHTIKTDTGLHEDRPNKLDVPIGQNNDRSFTVAGMCNGNWVYMQD
jgi:hypothetical protein